MTKTANGNWIKRLWVWLVTPVDYSRIPRPGYNPPPLVDPRKAWPRCSSSKGGYNERPTTPRPPEPKGQGYSPDISTSSPGPPPIGGSNVTPPLMERTWRIGLFDRDSKSTMTATVREVSNGQEP